MALKLCAPVIDAILSNLSTSVFVSNCLPNATIIVRSLTRPSVTLVKKAITAAEGFLALEPGQVLLAGDLLVARQNDNAGTTSPETSAEIAVHVGQAPTVSQDIWPVDIAGRLWDCGRHAFVGGAIAGATVEILRNGGAIESAVAAGGVARVALASAFRAREGVEVRQRIGGMAGPSLPREVEPVPLGAREALPAPVILPPVRACQTELRVEGVFEGAEVTLTRKSGEIQAAPFDLSGLWFILASPLAEANGWVKARQDMPECRAQGQEATTDIGPPAKPGTPFVHPLCAGAASVFIDNVERGAEVRIKVGTDEFVTTAGGRNRFDVEPLPPGTIEVQTFLCGIGSDVVTATVETAPVTIDRPAIIGDLFKCQLTIPVERLKPGATVQVWARGATMPERPISFQLVVPAPRMEIDVTSLIEGQDVWIVQWACAFVRRESAPVPVRPAPPIDDPDFTGPVTRIDKDIRVKGTVRDARVEIRRKIGDFWETIGRATAKGPETLVTLDAVLAVDQVLGVRQRYCTIQSPGRRQTKVLKPVPLKPDILSPSNGDTVPVGSAVTLSWSDSASGADADRKAESFQVKVLRDGSSVLDVSQTGTTATVSQAAMTAFGAAFQWTVTPRNSTGMGLTAQSGFKTAKAPDPTITAIQDKEKIKVTGSGFASSHPVEITVKVEYTVLTGSPNAPQQFNDNRQGTQQVTSNASGAIDATFVVSDVLEPRVEPTGTGGGSVSRKAPPYPGAAVKVKARNKPPIPASKGSPNPSNEESFVWAAP